MIGLDGSEPWYDVWFGGGGTDEKVAEFKDEIRNELVF